MILWLKDQTREKLESFSQVQTGHPSGCGPFSMAMAANLLAGKKVWDGADTERVLEQSGRKIPHFGIPPRFQPRAFQYLAPDLKTDLKINAGESDLLSCLAEGSPALVTLSWETNAQLIQKLAGTLRGKPGPVVGHVIVLVGYDFSARKFYFLDPACQGVTPYPEAEFLISWRSRPNLFIPRGSLLKISK
jgi:hypothetical protein